MSDFSANWKQKLTDRSDLDGLAHQVSQLEGHYVHIPFCRRLCPYCAFVKTKTFVPSVRKEFLNQLKKQIEAFRLFSNPRRPKTLYFGGGTPSLLPLRDVESIRSWFEGDVVEATFEYNPKTHSSRQDLTHYLKELRALGFNRLSLGAQSLNPDVLKKLGREHSPEDVRLSIEVALSLDFFVQVDVLYGFSGVSSRHFLNEVKELYDAKVTGVSLYSLMLEPLTPWEKREDLVSDHLACWEYENFLSWVRETEWFPYEVSHWASRPSLHNFIYWMGRPYFGYGPGAHGLLPPNSFHEWGRRYYVGAVDQPESSSDWQMHLLKNQKRQFQDHAFEVFWGPLRHVFDQTLETQLTLGRTSLGLQPPKNWQTNPLIQRALKESHLFQIRDRFVINPEKWMISNAWLSELV
jgi:oxygen-independent coproporphyrinogen-3 oxidase